MTPGERIAARTARVRFAQKTVGEHDGFERAIDADEAPFVEMPPPDAYEADPEANGERIPDDPAARIEQERQKQGPQLLNLTWAASLDDEPTYDQQLVPGLFERKGKALIFGPSMSGKTTFAIDIGCRVTAGMAWNSRTVLRGLVAVVAAESPEGTLRRARAFIRHHKVVRHEMPLAVYEQPLTFDLAAVDQLIATIASHSAAMGIPVRMVIIDTLAANEPGKEDAEHFGRVDRAQTRIRDGLDCLALVVHHSGKDADKGSRGHSSLFAGMDTVIEVSGTEGSRVATIAKQRDGASGDGIGFTLLPVGIGFRTVPDSPVPETVTACVVEYQGPTKRSTRQPRDGHQTRALDALRINQRDTSTVRWTLKEACEVFRTYHCSVVGDGEALHRNTPRKTFEALGRSGHVLIDGGFVTLQDT